MNRKKVCLLIAIMAATTMWTRNVDAQTYAFDPPTTNDDPIWQNIEAAPAVSNDRGTMTSQPIASVFPVSNGKPPVGFDSAGSAIDDAVDIEFTVPAMRSSAGHLSAWSRDLQGTLKQQFAEVDVKKMLSSLALVIGGYIIVVFLIRLVNPRGSGRLPSSVFEVVGSAQLNNRQSLQVVRLGSRLLMLLVSPEGAQPIGEISQPGEVQSMIAACEQSGATRRTARGKAISQIETNAALEKLASMLQSSPGQSSGNREFVA